MFILPRAQLPQQSQELAAALEEGLRQFVSSPRKIVSINGEKLADLDALEIDLSGATVTSYRPRFRIDAADAAFAFASRTLTISGQPLLAFGEEVVLQLHATNAGFKKAGLAGGNLLVVLNHAASGNFRAQIGRKALERLAMTAAAKVAARQGVTIESVSLSLTQPSARVVNAKVTMAARKFLFRPVLELSGTLGLSDDLSVTISDLRCHGEGPIAALACAAISPQFARVEGRPFALSALPLGEIHLKDVSFALTGDEVFVGATFGESSASA